MEANLKADLRDNSGSAESRRLRNAGSLPAVIYGMGMDCLLYTSPSPRDRSLSRMPSSA